MAATVDSVRTHELTPTDRLMQLSGGLLMSAAVHNVARLGIADLLAQGPRTAAQLAAKTGSNEDALNRLLRMLASVGVFAETAPGTYGLTPMSEALRTGVPGSMRDMVLFQGHAMQFKTWAALSYSIQTGKPAIEHVVGKPIFEYLPTDPDLQQVFNNAMSVYSTQIAPAVLDAYDFSGIGTLMDVAGGHGFVICEILRRYPQMKGIVLDMASVIEGAKCHMCDLRLDDRCTAIAGDFFLHIPAAADAFYMQHIIHDWPDEQALKILGNCRQAMQGTKDARLLVVDHVLPARVSSDPGYILDLVMLVFPSGRERTEQEWRDLFAKAGLRITRIVPTAVPESLIEARLA